MKRPYAEDAATFAAVAHDDGGMVALYNLLEDHTALWASARPAVSKREARRYMRACIAALASQMREIADDVIANDVSLPGGAK